MIELEQLKMHNLKMTDKVRKNNEFWTMMDKLLTECQGLESNGLENDGPY